MSNSRVLPFPSIFDVYRVDAVSIESIVSEYRLSPICSMRGIDTNIDINSSAKSTVATGANVTNPPVRGMVGASLKYWPASPHLSSRGAFREFVERLHVRL